MTGNDLQQVQCRAGDFRADAVPFEHCDREAVAATDHEERPVICVFMSLTMDFLMYTLIPTDNSRGIL